MWWSETRRKAWLQRALLVGSLLWLSACGFQFRTAPEFPADMAVTYIQAGDRYSLFYRELVSTLRRNDIKLTADPAEARTIIRILGDETGRRTLTVTARHSGGPPFRGSATPGIKAYTAGPGRASVSDASGRLPGTRNKRA